MTRPPDPSPAVESPAPSHQEESVSSSSPQRGSEDVAASGGSFVVGLLAGTVLGAGLAMIFSPDGSLARDRSEALADSGSLASPGTRAGASTAEPSHGNAQNVSGDRTET